MRENEIFQHLCVFSASSFEIQKYIDETFIKNNYQKTLFIDIDRKLSLKQKSHDLTIRPNNREELLKLLIILSDKLIININKIIISNLAYYFRDYDPLDHPVIANRRQMAYVLSKLKSLKIDVLIFLRSTAFDPERPLFSELIDYYGFQKILL